MICSICGTDNQNGSKFCIKCRSNLENPSKCGYKGSELSDRPTEEEFSERSICSKPVISAPKLKPPPFKLPPQNMVKKTSSLSKPEQTSAAKQDESSKKEKPDSVQAFYGGERTAAHREKKEIDLFGKTKVEQPNPNDPFADIDNRRKKRLREAAGPAIMSDMPIVDASKLEKHDEGKLYKIYMKETGDSRSNDLTFGSEKHRNRQMKETNIVDADTLPENVSKRSKIQMRLAGEANADDIEAYVPKHKEAIMSQADNEVRAVSKKTSPYEKELAQTEQPEYANAQKNVREGRSIIHSILKFKK